MTEVAPKKSIVVGLADVRNLLGAPPVLSSEDPAAYEGILARFVECFSANDFVEYMMMKHLTDCTWEIMRYTRHKTLTMERKFSQRLTVQAQRLKALAKKTEEQRRNSAETEAEEDLAVVDQRIIELEDVIVGSVADVDAILARGPSERDHARALEDAIEYHERLDKLLGTAIRMRNDVFEQIERYRAGLGQRLRKASDEIIDAEFSEAKPKEIAAPLVPSDQTGS